MHQSSTNPIREMLHGNGPQRDTVIYTHVSSVFVCVHVRAYNVQGRPWTGSTVTPRACVVRTKSPAEHRKRTYRRWVLLADTVIVATVTAEHRWLIRLIKFAELAARHCHTHAHMHAQVGRHPSFLPEDCRFTVRLKALTDS